MRLTDIKIRSLKAAAKPFDVKDVQVPGLHVRVMPSGKRTFVLLARFPGSRNPTRRALGGYGELTLAEARDKAREWRRLISRGIDSQIQQERERQDTLRQQYVTFAAVADEPIFWGKSRHGGFMSTRLYPPGEGPWLTLKT